jgi:hypothetical protein
MRYAIMMDTMDRIVSIEVDRDRASKFPFQGLTPYVSYVSGRVIDEID